MGQTGSLKGNQKYTKLNENTTYQNFWGKNGCLDRKLDMKRIKLNATV